jgi:hypothetical protein
LDLLHALDLFEQALDDDSFALVASPFEGEGSGHFSRQHLVGAQDLFAGRTVDGGLPEAQGGLERLDEIGQRVFELEQLELRCAGAQRARGGDAQANPIAGGWSRGQVEHEVSNVPHVRFGHL